jgi:hypothetical protein
VQPRRWRVALLAAAGAAAAVMFSGCAAFQIGSIQQVEPGGSVRVGSTVCAQGSAVCGVLTGDLNVPAADSLIQVLQAYRVPVGAIPPAGFTSNNALLTFTKSATYSAELQRLAPAPAGTVWIGYISTNALNYTTAGVVQSFVTNNIDFGLAGGADGSPFQGPFNYLEAMGGRVVSGALPATRPVNCGANLIDFATDSTVCVDDTIFGGTATAAGFDQQTRDLGIVAGAATASAPAGQTAQLVFQAKWAGNAAFAPITLAASTTLPGATATANAITFTPPTDSTLPVTVSVPVPAGAAPGTYDVTLTATINANQSRTGTGTLTVLPPPAVTPPLLTPPVITPPVITPPAVTPTTTPTVVKLKVSFALPKGLVAAIVTKKGIVLVFKTNKRVLTTIKLFQGKSKRALITKRATLKAPSTKVTLKSGKLKKGAIKITITGTGLNLTRTGTLK